MGSGYQGDRTYFSIVSINDWSQFLELRVHKSLGMAAVSFSL